MSDVLYPLCAKGLHEMTPDNTRLRPRKGGTRRLCRACIRESDFERNRKRRLLAGEMPRERKARGALLPMLRAYVQPEEWMEDRACRNVDTNLFFPARGENLKIRRALELCTGCPVREKCDDYAERINVSEGIWGGLTMEQRLKRRRRLRRAAGL